MIRTTMTAIINGVKHQVELDKLTGDILLESACDLKCIPYGYHLLEQIALNRSEYTGHSVKDLMEDMAVDFIEEHKHEIELVEP